MFHDKELMELMQNFYILTGMRIVLFDKSYNEVISYPADDETFCNRMRKNKSFYEKCCESDACSFAQCRKNKALTVFECHAGLVEATAPIMDNGKFVGYMMFGQISDKKNRDVFYRDMESLCRLYGVDNNDLETRIKKIKYRSRKQIQAASKILEACTGYIQLKEMVHLSEISLMEKIEEYIEAHISEQITIGQLCEAFNLSRTKLYDVMRQYISGGIAAFVRQKRLEKAKQLLQTKNMTVAEIADAVGFSDYNYFLRVFKHAYGISPKRFQKAYRQL